MRVAVVGRGRLGGALGRAAQAAGHTVTALRRPGAAPGAAPELAEEVLDADLDWSGFELVLLAFETKASHLGELERDAALRQLRRIPAATPVASVVWSPRPELVDALLAPRRVVHFLTTPAARLPGALALLPRSAGPAPALRAALPELTWVEADPEELPRLAALMIGSAIAAASLGHLARGRAGALTPEERALLPHVLDDAKRILELAGGDPFRAFSSVATPGGYTEQIHNALFATKWPLDS